jgi:hypothetical protein
MTFEDIKTLLTLELLNLDVPDWVNWVSVDEDGSVYMYQNKPYLHIERIETTPIAITEFYWTRNDEDIDNPSLERLVQIEWIDLETLPDPIWNELTSGWETHHHKRLLFNIDDLL